MATEMDQASEATTPPESPPESAPASQPRKRTASAVQQSEAARTVTACQNCRRKKVKCDGQSPCKYCSKRSLPCLFLAAEKRKMFSISEVRGLKAKVARYEGEGHADLQQGSGNAPDVAQELDGTSGPSIPRNAIVDQDLGSTLTSPVSNGPPALATPRSAPWAPSNPPSALPFAIESSSSPSVHTSNTTMALGTALSSTDVFGSEVRTLLGSRPTAGSAKTTPARAPSTILQELEGLGQIPGWPSEEEANELLEHVVLHVGISQQLFDVRSFSDNLSRLYHDSLVEQAVSSIWFTEALLVMAIGRLLLAKSDGPSDDLADSFYNVALKRLPHIGDAKRSGLMGIEVVALMGLYLQVADRKEEAYLYASMALRLAVSQNLHSARSKTQYVCRSESAHRNRLWWSVYMQERRLAAAGGHPMGIDDKAVTVDQPTDSLGYPSAAAIAVNVRAARITGQITSAIYSSHGSSEASFIEDVQNILHSLHEVKSTMPAIYEMGLRVSHLTIAGRLFNEVDQQTARTSSSLHLSIHQAVIHAVRPVLLYLARNSVDGGVEVYNDLSPTLRRLAEICVEAASRSLVILIELRNRQMIAKNVFLDLDAVFSAGFIFVLVEIINPGKGLGKSGIDDSRSILEHLVGLGNRAAAKRLAEMDQMCANLEPQEDQPPAKEPPVDLLTDNFSFELGYVHPETSANCSRDPAISSVGRTSLAAAEPSNIGECPVPMPLGDLRVNTDLADISLEGENGLFWVFQPGFYTGEELADWETLEGCLTMNQPT